MLITKYVYLNSIKSKTLKPKTLYFLLLVSQFSFAQTDGKSDLIRRFEQNYENSLEEIKAGEIKHDDYINACEEISEELNIDYYYGKFFFLKSLSYQVENNDSAVFFVESSIAYLQNTPDSILYVKAIFSKANLHVFGDEFFNGIVELKRTVDVLDKYLDNYLLIDEEEIQLIRAKCMASLGILYERFKDYDLALEFFSKSLKITEQLMSAESQRFLAVLMGNIGLIYSDKEQYKEGELYTIRSIDLKKKLNQDNKTGFNYRILGTIAYGRKKYRVGIKYLDIADKKYSNPVNQKELYKNDFWRAKILTKLGDYEVADELLTNLIAPFKENFTENDLADLYEELAYLYEQMKNKDNAVHYLKEALNVRKKNGDKEDRRGFDEFLFFFNQQESSFDDRVQYIRDKQEKERLSTQIESNRQRKIWMYLLFSIITIFLLIIIILFVKAGQRTKKSNILLQQNIEQKSVLFREVHHRVKNNFQIISSLLNLQKVTEADDNSKKALTEAKNRIQSMSLVHEMLYRTDDLSKINFEIYCAELARSIVNSYDSDDRVTYEILSDGYVLDLDVAIPLGLILNEGLTNAIKYAFENRENGHIIIELFSRDGENNLIIKDNGVGLKLQSVENEESSLGLELIDILVDQLDGKVKIDGENGTTVHVIIKA